jgi:putative copper export protein
LLHVDTLGAFGTTDYGRALFVKLVIVAGLVALGAINLPIGATTLPTANATTSSPSVTAMTVMQGLAAFVTIVVLLGGAFIYSRRQSTHLARRTSPLSRPRATGTDD